MGISTLDMAANSNEHIKARKLSSIVDLYVHPTLVEWFT